MAQLGSAVSGVGDMLYKHEMAAKEFETEAKFQEFKWQQERDLDEQMRAVEPGQAGGFPDQWAEGYKERAKEFVAGVPSELKPKYDAKLFGTERQLYGTGSVFARKEQARSSINALEDHKNRLAQSGDLDSARADYDSLLSKNPYLSPIEKDEVRRKHLDDLEEQNVDWRINRGEALDQIIRDLQQPARTKDTGLPPPSSTLPIERHNDGMATVRTGSGAGFRVAGDHAERFAGAISDLEAAGVDIKGDQSGGYNPRNIRGTNTPSEHASGRAIDVNWAENAQGTKGAIDPELARSVAAKWGLKWGGDFSKPDPMHFEVAKDAKPLPVSQRGITSFAGMKPAGEGEPATDADGAQLPASKPASETGEPPSGKYLHLSPKRRHALLTRARIALSDTTQRDLKDAAAEAARTGVVPADEAGQTALDRARTVLTPNQLSKAKGALDEAVMGFKATAPLASMTEDEAYAHISSLAPSERVAQGERYASAAKVYDKAAKDWQTIKELRTSDPVKAISGGNLKRGSGPQMSVAEDGSITVRQDDDLRLQPAPEIAKAAAFIKRAQESQRIPAGINGKLFTTLRTDPITAREMLLEARLEAQTRLGIANPKLISREEADAVLQMPKGVYKDIESKTYMDGVKAAADRFYATYGPKYGRRAFEDAIGFHLAKEADVKDADRVMAKVIATYASGKGMNAFSPADLRDVRQGLESARNLEEIDRVGRLFEGQGQFPATGVGAPERPAIATPTDTLTGITNYAARQARQTPSEDDIAWALAKPSRQENFDRQFGRGAYARELAKRQQP